MSSRTEQEWKQLTCPRKLDSDNVSRSCLGSACAAFWWDTPRPPDDIERRVSSQGGQFDADGCREHTEIHGPLAKLGWTIEKVVPKNPEYTSGYRYYEVHWSRPWQPNGFCSAFPHPDRFPASE